VNGVKALALDAHDRPREKLAQLGAAALGDNELLAVVIGGGVRGMDGLSIANALLQQAGGLCGLIRLRHPVPCRIKGLGAARAAQVQAAIELGRRTLARRPPTRVRLGTPREVGEYLLPIYGGRPTEQFGVILLDARHTVLRTVVLTVGAVDAVVVRPRDVFRDAAAAGVPAIVLFHNHPSGDPTPSTMDLLLTERFVRAGELLGIDVVDHVILGDGQFFSLKEAGRI
jgi:DNA repair protein RadC